METLIQFQYGNQNSDVNVTACGNVANDAKTPASTNTLKCAARTTYKAD